MKPATHTVQELFERDVRYIVPLYQRPYVWDEEHQWEPLWDDVAGLLQHQESGEASSVRSHFMGAIVLDQEPTVPGQIPRYTVIDGQQRLTTLQLLLAAAASALETADAADDAALLRELMHNNKLKAKGTERLKVWPTNANRRAFAAVMGPDAPPDGHEDDPDNLIEEAYGYFTARATEYIVEVPSEGRAARCERLRITLCDLVKLVSITLEQDDNAQVIFETLNARGTPLLALDLVKNSVFHEASRRGKDTDALYEQVWRPQLDDDYWRVDRRQGRLFRPVGELFLMHWLTMRLEGVIPATELFQTFKQRVLTDGEPESLIRELCADAAVMRSFDHQAPGTPEALFFRRLEALDASTILPLVILLFRTRELTVTRRRRALRVVESWLARRALMRLTSKNYNRQVPRLVAKVKGAPDRADEILLEELRSGEGEISRWPGDDEFVESLTTRDVYGLVSQARLTMALEAVELGLYTSKTDLPQLPGSLSLEHLLPQSWESSWPLPNRLDDREMADATAARTARLHRLGNLTIVTQPLNSALSNGPWQAKRAALNANSKLLINVSLAGREAWDEQAIDERTVWIAQRLCSMWPASDSTSWQTTATGPG